MRYLSNVILVTLITLMAVAINLPQSYLELIRVDPLPIKLTLLALILVGLTIYRGLALIVLTLMLVLGASLPDDLANHWNIDKQAMFYALLMLGLIPLLYRWWRGPR